MVITLNKTMFCSITIILVKTSFQLLRLLPWTNHLDVVEQNKYNGHFQESHDDWQQQIMRTWTFNQVMFKAMRPNSVRSHLFFRTSNFSAVVILLEWVDWSASSVWTNSKTLEISDEDDERCCPDDIFRSFRWPDVNGVISRYCGNETREEIFLWKRLECSNL